MLNLRLLSVPKILALLIPEIPAHFGIAGRDMSKPGLPSVCDWEGRIARDEGPRTRDQGRNPKSKGGWCKMRNILWTSLWCGLLLSSTGWAADKAEQDIRATVLKSAEGWSTLNPDNNDAIYTSSARAVFFDVAPMEYIGWTAYKEGFKKAFAGFKSFKLSLNDDLAVHHAGDLGWATVTWKADGQTKDDKAAHLEGRATLVLQEQGGKWKIIHEHYSVPAQL